MSAFQKFHSAALRSAMFAVVALGLGACANSSSTGVPQEGALRSGTYPSFGRVPRGETAQLTFEEKEQITGNLANDKARQGGSVIAGSSSTDIEARKRALQAETEATLKAIETSQ